MIRTDCLYYIGEKPCTFHKKYKAECNDQCIYYKKIGLRIIIIKKSALGDVLRTTPILHAIKKKYGSNTHVTWITDPSCYEILKFNPFINRIYLFDFNTITILEFEKFDILFNLDKDLPALALSKKVKAKHKFGFTMNKYGNLITFKKIEQYSHRLGISDKLKKENKKSYQEIVCELLDLPYSKDYKYILNIPNQNEKAKKLCQKYGIDRNNFIIGFNTGAGPKFLTKSWPKQYFIDLGIDLIKKHNYNILLFGADSEKDIINYIYNQIKSGIPEDLEQNIVDTGINNTILEFATLISLSDLIITSDTLGMHLAIALEMPSISFFGPTSSSEIDLYGKGIKIVANSPCLSCYRQSCNYHTFCLSTIKPEYVYKKILELIKEKKLDRK